MKIKSLQMHGFKSFGDRTELQFTKQTVGIVGPNGCGKSNIVDAIRWAMGEQSAKGLRGSEMSDVIFNGTATRKKAAFAEVSLIFDNADKQAPHPYTDCSEVMITRRLFRSGESEYLINKVPVRLKDINDLFLGTGSSARAYSIVAQGKVDQVVLAKPEDRRLLLEEAAGIAKYKVRKLSAERKMESTKVNLERVHDIIRELERSAKHLDRQVEKAEQFRKLQAELRHIDEQIIGFKVTQLDRRVQENQTEKERIGAEFEKVSAEFSQLEAEIETWRLQTLDLEKLSTSDYEKLIQLKEKHSTLDKERDLSSQRIVLLGNQITDRERDLERISSKSLANAEAVKQIITDKEALELERAKKKQGLDDLKAKLSEAESEIQDLENKISERAQALDESRTQMARLSQKREMLQAERVSEEIRRAEKEEEILEIQNAETKALSEADFLKAEVTQVESEIHRLEADTKEIEALETTQSQNLAQLFEEKRTYQEKLAYCEAEIKSLVSLEEHEVGYQTGALEYKKRTGQPMLLDQLRFKTEFQKVGEAFLSEFGQSFLSGGGATENDLSHPRWSTLFVETMNSENTSLSETLLDTIEADPQSLNESLRNLLSRVELIEELSNTDNSESRIQIDRAGRMRIPMGMNLSLCSQGELVRRDTPFGRKAELEKLNSDKSQFVEELQKTEERIANLQSAISDRVSRLEGLRQSYKSFNQKLQEQRTLLSKAEGQKDVLAVRRASAEEEIASIDFRLKEIETALDEASPVESFAELEAQIAEIESSLESRKAEKAELDRDWIESRIAFGAVEEKLERLSQQIVHSEMTHSEYSHNRELFQTDIVTWKSEIERETKKIADSELEMESHRNEISRLERAVEANKSKLNENRHELERLELTRKDQQKIKGQLQEKLQELELEHQRLRHEVDELSNIVHERYHIGLEEILSQIRPEDLDRLSDETVFRALEVEAIDLRERVEKFGDVNLLAVSEYTEIKKRLEFMNTQREDLLKTLDALQSIIDRINQVTEFRFRETFKAINHNFQILFPKLFGGGRAYMTLTDEKNLLETGVEIFAEPPGKKVQAMSLLSGGEKAMTSISLLFALFAYRPASFCILDEVDAPLDDVNTTRYNSIIMEMSSLSQFIVITHNKRTMEVADALFGVTMQEPGVSQLVGVELQEARAFVATGAA